MSRPTFGQQIQALREDLKLSQYELALKVGYGVRAISYWERDMSLPGTAELVLLAKALGCRVVIAGDSINLVRPPRAGIEGHLNGHARVTP